MLEAAEVGFAQLCSCALLSSVNWDDAGPTARMVLSPCILTTLSPLIVGRILCRKRENIAWFCIGLRGTLT